MQAYKIDRINLIAYKCQENCKVRTVSLFLIKLINESGLWGHIKDQKSQFHWRDDCGEMRKIVLGLLDSPDLRKRFGKLCRDLGLLNSRYKPAIIIILCCQSMHLRVSPVDILSDGAENILRDPQFLSNPATKDLFDISDGSTKISLRSSLIAKHLLQEIASSNEIYREMKKIAKYCDKQYSQSKKAETSLKSLVSASEVTHTIREKMLTITPIDYFNIFKIYLACDSVPAMLSSGINIHLHA